MSRMTKNTRVTCGIYLYQYAIRKILVCHATNSSWTKWSIPKGLIDPGEDKYSCAIRELKEETGIDIDGLHILEIHALPAMFYAKQNRVLESFLLITDTDLAEHVFRCGSIVENKYPEIDSWKWIHLELADKYVHESQARNIDRITSIVNKEHVIN